MTWKSTAIVTGATALVGWFASAPPRTSAPKVAAEPSQAAQATPRSDIEQQAARLRARLREEVVFRRPSRDPFRFAARPAQVRSRDNELRPVASSDPTPVAQAPLLTLSGMASDVVEGITQRIAILSAPDGVLLVREGDHVGGLYRVGKIDEDAVDLVRVVDGELLRLRLAGHRP